MSIPESFTPPPTNPTRIVSTANTYTSLIGPSTLDPSPASTQTNPMDSGYQPKPEGKENHSYKSIHHIHTNQVIMNNISHWNHKNIIDNADNLVHDAYCKKKQTRETSDLSNRTNQPRLTGYMYLKQAL